MSDQVVLISVAVVGVLLSLIVFCEAVTRGRWRLIELEDSSSFLDSMPPFENSQIQVEPRVSKEIAPFTQYRTVSGWPVEILSTSKPGDFPVVGYIVDSGLVLQWDRYGNCDHPNPEKNIVEAFTCRNQG